MKNNLTDMHNLLLAQMETLADGELTGDKLDEEIKRAEAMTDIAKPVIANGRLVLDAQKVRRRVRAARGPARLEGAARPEAGRARTGRQARGPGQVKPRASWLRAECLAWLRDEYPRHPARRTLALFNARFGEHVTYKQLLAANKRHRFGRAAPLVSRQFGAAEREWLAGRLPALPRAEVRRLFKARFGRDPGLVSLNNYAQKHGLTGAPNTGRYRPGHVPFNKGKGRPGVWPAGSERGHFRPGQRPANKRPLYAERWGKSKGGSPILQINVPSRDPYTGAANRWVRKARWAWERANGPVPAGSVVVQIDGDPPTASPPTSPACRARCCSA